MGKIPSRGVDQFVLRFPDGLRDRIRDVAEKNGRSMNAEIIARLIESFETDHMMSSPEASFDALLPIAKALGDEVAKRYEARFLQIEEVMSDVAKAVRGEKVIDSDLGKLADALETGAERSKQKRTARKTDLTEGSNDD